MEVACILFYGVIGFWSGESQPWFLLIELALVTMLAAFGKRQHECTERLFFLQILSERRLRTEAEFQLSQSRVEAPKPEDTASAQTSMVARAVQGVLGQQQLELLTDIGRRE